MLILILVILAGFLLLGVVLDYFNVKVQKEDDSSRRRLMMEIRRHDRDN